MRAGGFAVGSAMFGPREMPRHDPATEGRIEAFRQRIGDYTDAAVLGAAAALDRPFVRQHPLCPEYRAIVDAELDRRHLSLAPLAGGAR